MRLIRTVECSCLEKRFKEDKHDGILINTKGFESQYDKSVEGMCASKNINLNNIGNDAYKMFFHRAVDCPLKFSNNSHKKTRGTTHKQ